MPNVRRLWVFVALTLTVPGPTIYCGTYVWARATHRLVNCGGLISDHCHGRGFGNLEILFAPLILTENTVRRWLGR